MVTDKENENNGRIYVIVGVQSGVVWRVKAFTDQARAIEALKKTKNELGITEEQEDMSDHDACIFEVDISQD